MSTPKKIHRSKKSKRSTVQIPEGTKIHDFIFNNGHTSAYWQVLEKLIEESPSSKEDWAQAIINDFITRITILYPEKKTQFESLRPLMVRKIIKGEKLPDEYFKDLKES